jgi:hypothetical protein
MWTPDTPSEHDRDDLRGLKNLHAKAYLANIWQRKGQ